MRTIDNIINGQQVAARSHRTAPVFNPATGEHIANVGLAGADDVAQAVAAAVSAYPQWAATPPLNRSRAMFRFKALLDANADTLARTIATEHGKTHADALGEVTRGIEVVEFACGIPHLLKGSFTRNVGSDIDAYSDRQPLGVVAGITPFNFPAMVPLWMFPVALACGNCFILKPSEKDPSTANRLHALAAEAGFPDGVFNVVHGEREAVDALLAHPDVRAISFVGSTPVARHIYATATANGKRVQALGGAKNHLLVMPDADIEFAADAIVGAGYGSAGERCMAVSVAVPVGQETADALVGALKPRVHALKVGPASDPSADMGPLITAAHRDRVTDLIGKGVAEGAELVVDGRGIALQGYEEGYFLGGTLFDRVTADMTIYREEIFGPVLSVVRVNGFDEAVELVNGNEYGNGTAIFTRDGESARNFADRIEAGMVGINIPIPVPVAYHSFGGWKNSLFGDHAIYGPEGVHFYTRLKTVTTRWPSGGRSGPEFSFPTRDR